MATPPNVPATAVLKITYRVLPGECEAFENTLRGMVEAGKDSSGKLGIDMLKPEPGSENADEWKVLLRYRTVDDLRAWQESPTAKMWCSRLEALTTGAPETERVPEMEAWFSLPDHRDVLPAPRWKLAIISGIAIYPLIFVVPPVMAPLVGGAPKWLAVLAQMLVLVPIMNWVTLPALRHLLRAWLYKERPAPEAKP